MTSSDVTWYRRRWYKVTIISLIVIVAVAAVAAGIVFLRWNTSQEKTLFDVADYALKTPGRYHVQAKDMDLKVDVNGQKYAANGMMSGTKLEAVMSNDTLYIKSSDPEKLYDMFLAQSVPQAVLPLVHNLLPGLRDKWISMNLQDLPTSSTNAMSIRCLLDGKEILAADSNSRQQVTGAYLAHPFISIMASSRVADKSIYNLSIDDKKFNSFYEKFAQTGFSQSLTTCPQLSHQAGDQLQKITVTVEITQSSRQLRKVSIIKPDGRVTITADYASAPKIIVPASSTSYEQISSKIMQSYLQPFLSGL